MGVEIPVSWGCPLTEETEILEHIFFYWHFSSYTGLRKRAFVFFCCGAIASFQKVFCLFLYFKVFLNQRKEYTSFATCQFQDPPLSARIMLYVTGQTLFRVMTIVDPLLSCILLHCMFLVCETWTFDLACPDSSQTFCPLCLSALSIENARTEVDPDGSDFMGIFRANLV